MVKVRRNLEIWADRGCIISRTYRGCTMSMTCGQGQENLEIWADRDLVRGIQWSSGISLLVCHVFDIMLLLLMAVAVAVVCGCCCWWLLLFLWLLLLFMAFVVVVVDGCCCCVCVCRLCLQDLALAMDAASSSKSLTPLGSQATQLYRLLCEQGYADKDFTVMFKFLEKKDQ